MVTPSLLTARVLVPLDGSDLAAQALAYARTLQTSGTEVLLAQVLPDPEPRYDADRRMRAPVDAVLDAERTTATHALEQLAAAWGLPADRVEIAVPVWDPASTLLGLADDRDCSLMLLASHGRGAIGRWRFGSVADRLARSATIPTAIVRPDTTAADPGMGAAVARLVVPLDGSPRAEHALPVAGALGRQLRCPVHLVRVVPPPEGVGMPVGAPGTIGTPALAILHDRAESDAAGIAAAWSYLEAVADHPALAGVETVPDVLGGEAAPRLLEVVTPADLVVLTSRGRSGVPRWLLGSVAEKLVREAAGPVCLVPTAPRAGGEHDAGS
jgi:nucleotide-binding universal stress UspA family protein